MISLRYLSLPLLLLALSSCVGRDQMKPFTVTQDCMGTCTVTMTNVVEPMTTLTIPLGGGLPGGL